MENYLFPLKSSSTSWLSSSSTSWVIDTIIAFLCGLGLFLLLLPCLQGSPSLPSSRKHRNNREHQREPRGRNRSRKKSQTVEACRDCLKELELARNRISLLQSRLGKCHDKGSFRQLLCQDHPDEMCKAAPAGSRWSCMERVDNVVPSMSPSTSPALSNEQPLPLASTFPRGPMTSLHSINSQSSTNVLESLETPFPLECLSPHLPDPLESGASPSPPPVSSASQPLDFTLTLPQCDSLALPLDIFPQSSSLHSPWPVSPIPLTSGIGHPSCPMSALTWWQKTTKDLRLSTSSFCESQEEHLACHPPEALFCGGSTDRQTETGSLSLLNSNDQELLKIQATKRVEIKVWKEKEDGSYSKEMNPEYHLNSLGNIFKSLGTNQNHSTSQPIWSTEGKPKQLPNSQQLSYTKGLGDHLQQKYNQLFWGLPSLHSESLVATAWISESSSALQSPSFLFNVITNACPVRIQAKISPLLSQSQPLSHLDFQSQHLIPTIPQFQPLSQSHLQIKVPLQSSLSSLTPSSPQIRDCGKSCPAVPNEPQSPTPTETQHLKWPLLQKQLECGWTLSSVVRRSQEIFSVFSSTLPEDNWVVSILPENFPISPELRKQLEQHLQKWLIQHRWELPQRIQESLELKQLQCELPNISQCKLPNTKRKLERSQTSLFIGESSKGTQKMGFQLSKDMDQGLGHILGKVSKDSSTGSDISLVKGWGMNFKESDSDLRPSSRESGSDERVLKRYLCAKSGQIKEDLIQRSWVAVTHVFPRFKKYREKRNLRLLKDWEPCVNTSRRITFLHPCTREILESHIIRFWVKHRWGLPLKVLTPINCFKLKKKAQSLPLLQCDSPPSATCLPVAHSRIKFAMSWEEFPQAHLGEKITKESGLTLEKPLLPPSPVCDQGWLLPVSNREPSETLLTVQEGKLSSHSFTSDQKVGSWQSETMNRSNSRQEAGGWDPQNPSDWVKTAEMNSGFKPSRAQETGEVLGAESPALQLQSRDNLGSCVLTKLSTRNVHMRNSMCPVTSESPLLPRTYVSQDSGESCLNIELARELEFQAHLHREEQYIDYPTYMFPTEDSFVSWVPHCHLQRLSCGDVMTSPMICGFIADQSSSRQHQEFRILRSQDSWKSKRKSKVTDPTYEREDCKSPDGREYEGCQELQASQVGSWSHPTQVRIVNSFGSKCLQKQIPPESFFRKGMRLFFQWIFSSKKGKSQGCLQRCKPAFSTVQRQGSGKSKSIMDGETAEARALMTAVGQILEEKMAHHQELQAIKLSEHKQELQSSECGGYCSYRSSFHLEKRKGSYTTCSHQVTLQTQNCSTREKHVKPRQSLKSVRFNDDRSPSTPPKKTVSPVSSHQNGPKIPAAPGCHHHCPRHCLFQGGVFPGQP